MLDWLSGLAAHVLACCGMELPRRIARRVNMGQPGPALRHVGRVILGRARMPPRSIRLDRTEFERIYNTPYQAADGPQFISKEERASFQWAELVSHMKQAGGACEWLSLGRFIGDHKIRIRAEMIDDENISFSFSDDGPTRRFTRDGFLPNRTH